MSAEQSSPLDLTRQAIAAIVDNWHEAMKISLVWYLVYVASSIASALTSEPYAGQFGLGEWAIFSLVILGLVGMVVSLSSIAIAWHKFMLKGDARNSYIWFENSAPIFHYFWVAFLALAAGFLCATPLIFVAFNVSPGNSNMPLVFWSMGYCVALFVSIRLGLKLPAIALGYKDYSFRMSWKQTSNRAVQIAVASILLAIVAMATSIITTGSDFPTPRVGLWALIVVQSLVGWPTMMFGISLLTTLYSERDERAVS